MRRLCTVTLNKRHREVDDSHGLVPERYYAGHKASPAGQERELLDLDHARYGRCRDGELAGVEADYQFVSLHTHTGLSAEAIRFFKHVAIKAKTWRPRS